MGCVRREEKGQKVKKMRNMTFCDLKVTMSCSNGDIYYK